MAALSKIVDDLNFKHITLNSKDVFLQAEK